MNRPTNKFWLAVVAASAFLILAVAGSLITARHMNQTADTHAMSAGRPDWEAVLSPVIDFALSRKEVARDRIALFGYSMGGYPRRARLRLRCPACRHHSR
jgi:hypothetical protein